MCDAAFYEEAGDEGGAELIRGVGVVQAVGEDYAPGFVGHVDEAGFGVGCWVWSRIGRRCSCGREANCRIGRDACLGCGAWCICSGLSSATARYWCGRCKLVWWVLDDGQDGQEEVDLSGASNEKDPSLQLFSV